MQPGSRRNVGATRSAHGAFDRYIFSGAPMDNNVYLLVCLRTRDAVTPSLNASDVALSLFVYVVAYVFIFGAGLLFMARLVRRGFDTDAGRDAQAPAATPARPISAASRIE